MTAEAGGNKNTFLRKPGCILWSATVVVTAYAVWCVLLLILTASGHLLNSQSFECGDSAEDLVASRLNNEASSVYLCSGLSLPVCLLLLLEFWRKKGFYLTMLLCSTLVLFVIMCVFLTILRESELQEIIKFEKRYLDLLPLTDRPGNRQNQLTGATCSLLNNVHRWQTEFHCCGLQDYKDWGSSLPDSCLCSREDNSTGCVDVGSNLVYEKPCLPTVVSLVEKRSFVFWAIMIASTVIIGTPVAAAVLFILLGFTLCIYCEIQNTCCYRLSFYVYKLCGGEKMVPVVFMKNNNNNQTEEKTGKDQESKESGVDGGAVVDGDVVVDVEGSTHKEGEGQETAEKRLGDNAMSFIPLSQLRRLQDELNPPPVRHQVRCLCLFSNKNKNFYVVLIDEDSPLLPSGAELVDANKPRECFWAEGPHIFVVDGIVWPKDRRP